MRTVSIVFFILISNFLKAQIVANDVGIRFEQGLSWSQVKDKAWRENKYIFVDCFATWCGPCKQMDQKVFTKDSVGNFYNSYFVNVKLQFDTTNHDNPEILEWFKVAREFEKEYAIKGYPTYLFFSPNGKLVDKIAGATATSDLFVKIGDHALDTSLQYYSVRDKFLIGDHTKATILKILPMAISRDDLFIAHKVHNYFYDSVTKPLSKEDLSDIYASISQSEDKGFEFILNNKDIVNSLLGEDKAQSLIKTILMGEVYQQYIKYHEGHIDWHAISVFLHGKTIDFADNILLALRITDAYQHKQWDEWSRMSLDYYDKYNSTLSHNERWFMNNILMEVFNKCNEKSTLQRAAEWSKKTIGMYTIGAEDVDCMDTYANLLYKSGNLTQALLWEKKALDLAVNQPKTTKEIIKENLLKMQNGTPTWPVKIN